MNCCNVLFAGFGGQGLLFSGKILATAGLLENKDVSWLPSYGPEMRGGTANCAVRLSDSPIGSPLVTEPDVLVAMNLPSFTKYINAVVPGGMAVVDSSLVKAVTDRQDVSIFEVDATRISKEEGLFGVPNVILLGKLIKETGVVPVAAIELAVRKCVPDRHGRLLENNLKALHIGIGAEQPGDRFTRAARLRYNTLPNMAPRSKSVVGA
jgi:2-oxoglutarate ferredoxin oxidoreductase subunit gamma